MPHRWAVVTAFFLSAASAYADIPPGPATRGSAIPYLGLSAIGVIGIVAIIRRRRSRRPIV